MVITFSGLDGSGKSTQVAKLVVWLQARRIDYRIVETHRLTLYSLLGRFIRMCWPVAGRSLVQEHYDLHRNSLRRRFVGWLRKIFFWVDVLTFSIWVKVFLDRSDRIVVCDRSMLDEAVQLVYLGFCSERGFVRRLKACPAVTRAFFLSVPPETAYTRNPEYPIEHFTKKDYFYGLSREIVALVPLQTADPDHVHKCTVGNVTDLLEKRG